MGKNDQYFAWSYPHQKFSGALGSLCLIFDKYDWKRVEAAVSQLLALLPDQFPEQDLYERTQRLIEQATEFGPLEVAGIQVQGSLAHTLRRRKRKTLRKYAKEILEIHTEILRRQGPYRD